MAIQIADFDARVIESGRRAYFAGLSLSDCVFAIGSQSRRLWRKGWNDARQGKDSFASGAAP